eukprot:TRINITY_DN20678_c0_g1_i2.p1 TRINITY_DN20678_c0_g1~~TRINITY_DN20678_c0_g1_i2.p1  ORF type:complete len:431 (+),score=70.41 TRINITY_DN20678_c0_g1_i2:46-1293(+)
MSEGKPPGNFGWFGGASDSSKFVSDPVGYIRKKTGKHGGVFSAKIAGDPCVFAGGYAAAKDVFVDDEGFPTETSMLEMIQKPVGTPFLLTKNKEEVKYWRRVLVEGLQTISIDEVTSVIHPEIDRWIASSQPLPNFYGSAKALFNSLLFRLLLGSSSTSEATLSKISELQTLQFRGCEAIPLEGLPSFMQTAFEKGIIAKKDLTNIVINRGKAGKLGPLGGFLYNKALADGRAIQEIGEHLTFLIHGIVPKALASALLYTWMGLTKEWMVKMENDDGLLKIFVKEALRLKPPIGVMGRGVATGTFRSYKLDPKHGSWKCFPGIASANTDPSAYGSTSHAFAPHRFAAPTPEPLTFGAGPRSCPGGSLTSTLLEVTVSYLISKRVVPVFDPSSGYEEKTLPVRRPTTELRCRFVKY